MRTEEELIALCMALIGENCKLSPAERVLARRARQTIVDSKSVMVARKQVLSGSDPLGHAFSKIRSADSRRELGAVYTPNSIVRSMMTWLQNQGTPCRIVDPGAGSGHFIIAAGELFPDAQLIAVELDPLAALMLRANLTTLNLISRTTILVKDYRQIKLPHCVGATAFIGNPPFVRHHGISETWKNWYTSRLKDLGIKASALAGLHLHFFLQTRLLAKPGDIGAFITSAEWMDVNYGSALRQLLLNELGGTALHVLEPTVEAFPGTSTTAAITCFRIGEAGQTLRVRSIPRIELLNGLTQGIDVARERFKDAPRWSVIVRPPAIGHAGEIELGELFNVHRGQVTGANDIWIAGNHATRLPARVMLPTVTKAKDLILAGAYLQNIDNLRQVIDLPPDLDGFSRDERKEIDAFLSWAKAQGADKGYVASHRKAWWSVGLKNPAPVLCTYMARRPPQFTINDCGARHINIAHGLYPREPMQQGILTQIVTWLNGNITTHDGRTYAGGLTKFEPREIERLRIPRFEGIIS